MVTDIAAYIGTSNWSGDYFIDTAGKFKYFFDFSFVFYVTRIIHVIYFFFFKVLELFLKMLVIKIIIALDNSLKNYFFVIGTHHMHFH